MRSYVIQNALINMTLTAVRENFKHVMFLMIWMVGIFNMFNFRGRQVGRSPSIHKSSQKFKCLGKLWMKRCLLWDLNSCTEATQEKTVAWKKSRTSPYLERPHKYRIPILMSLTKREQIPLTMAVKIPWILKCKMCQFRSNKQCWHWDRNSKIPVSCHQHVFRFLNHYLLIRSAAFLRSIIWQHQNTIQSILGHLFDNLQATLDSQLMNILQKQARSLCT